VYGAISSSAPVLAELNFYQYLQVVQQSLLSEGSSQCVSNVRNAMNIVQGAFCDYDRVRLITTEMMSTADGRQKAQSMFNLCGPLNTDNDIYTFISDLAGNFMGTVQYNAEIPGQPTISDVCAYMTNASDALTGLVNVNNLFLQLQEMKCLDQSYDNMLAELKNTSQVESVGGRQWIWQTCTEYVIDILEMCVGALMQVDLAITKRRMLLKEHSHSEHYNLCHIICKSVRICLILFLAHNKSIGQIHILVVTSQQAHALYL